MIKMFLCKETERIFNGIGSIKFANIQKVAKRKLDMIHFANSENDLRVPPSNRLEQLKGNLKGFYSIRINDQYRIIFKFENQTAFDVKIIDYHK